jgi:hypothetical protein
MITIQPPLAEIVNSCIVLVMTETKIEDLVGLTEIAELYGVHKQTVNGWRRNSDFPAPVLVRAMGPLWDRSKLVEWKRPPRYPRDGDGMYFDVPCSWCGSKKFDSLTLRPAGASDAREPAFLADCQDCGKTTHIRFYTASIDTLTVMTRQYTLAEEVGF